MNKEIEIRELVDVQIAALSGVVDELQLLAYPAAVCGNDELQELVALSVYAAQDARAVIARAGMAGMADEVDALLASDWPN